MKKRIIFLSLLIFSLLISAGLYYNGSIGLNRNTTWSFNLTGWRHSSLVFGDIDNDGDYDMIGMGCSAGATTTCTTADKIRVYINNGTTFNENLTWESNTTNLGYGSLALGDIDNDGDLDLAALGDVGGGTGDVIIYVNNGTTFNEDLVWKQNLSGIDAFAGSLAFSDIDSDGDLDLALVGAYPSGNNGIYINNGTSFVKDSTWISSFSYVGHGSGMGALALGDYDNDGDLDLIFLGSFSTDQYRETYINNGTALVRNSTWENEINNDYWAWPSLTFGDYDNDGDLDLITMGTAGTGDKLYLYNNTGSTFTYQQHISSFFDGSVTWGDYDNDGDLDLAVMGKEEGANAVVNNNGTYFQFDTMARADLLADDMQQGSLVWVDLDNDSNLDLVCSGLKYGDDYLTKIYINNNTVSNTQPNASTKSFSSSYSDGVLSLGWGNGSDSETSTAGLYYNLMVGNSTTNHTIVSGIYGGSSNPTAGYFGNMMQRKNISLNKYLSADTYYWYVQTIDTGLAKSNWSTVQSIVVGGDTIKPTITSVSSSVTSTTATITWTTDENSNSSVLYGTTRDTTLNSGSDDSVTSHSIGLTGLSASTLYYYNVSSCDYWANCNTSIQYNFTTSALSSNGNGGNGGGGNGGNGGTTTIVTPTPEVKEFDIDFSTETTGTLEVKQGDVKTFSFQGAVKHSITTLTITSNSVTLLITSDPITIQIKTGETKQIDMNNDGIDDIEIKLISIIFGKAKFTITKLEGADIVAQEELEKEALFDVKISIVNLFKIVKSGREIIAEIEVFNVNNIGQVDVLVDYYITDKDNNTIATGSDTLAVEAVASFVRSLDIPYELKSGKYLFNVNIKYQDKIMASGIAEFRVLRNYEIIITVGIIVLIVIGIFFYLWRIKKKEERDVGMLKRQISKLKRKPLGMLGRKKKKKKK